MIRALDRFRSLALLPRLLLCTLAGALNVLAFAPFGWWPLQIVLLAPLLRMTADEASARRNFAHGWAYGTGWLTAGFYWLYISMHHYGGMPSLMAAFAVVLLALALGSLYGLALAGSTYLQRRWRVPAAWALVLLHPAAWAVADWVRGWIFTGFPWLAAGYAHTASPLAGFAPIVGVYGLGLLAALMAACFALLPSKKWPVLVPVVLLAAGFGLQKIDWTTSHGKPISVRLLQGNVPQEMKFDSEQVYASLAMYRDLIVREPADLIVTPETAITLFLHQLPTDFMAGIGQFARQSHSHVMLGMPVSDGAGHYANSAIGVPPDAPETAAGGRTFLYRYDKHHLVPFGEFIPYGFHWFVAMMNIPLGDFSKAPVLQPPFKVKDQAIQPDICYEDLFGEEIAAQIRAGRIESGNRSGGPTILLNMSNIAWFGDSLALPQHLQISQMRALETGRPMLRATNTGMTAVIDPKGQVVAHLQRYTRGALSASVQGYDGATPYILFGNGLFVGLAALSLLLAFVAGRKKPFPS